jgi:integrase
VLEKPLGYMNGVVRAKRPSRLPVVLTRQEIRTLFGCLDGMEWLMATLLYGAGLRLMECLRLRVQEVDFSVTNFLYAPEKGIKIESRCYPLPRWNHYVNI